MASAPVISIYQATGGPVARGVLVRPADGGDKSGLFSPWPKSLTEEVAFAVYLPASMEWLAPNNVWILEGIDNKNGTLGVVSFTSEPSLEAGAGSISKAEYDKIMARGNASLWDGLKAFRANDIRTLATLNSSRVIPDDSLTNLNSKPATAKPKVFERRGVADMQLNDFFCRYLLRWD